MFQSTSERDESSDPPSAKRPALATSECIEVASFVGTRFLSADCRYNVLINHFKPGANYSFPKSNSTG